MDPKLKELEKRIGNLENQFAAEKGKMIQLQKFFKKIKNRLQNLENMFRRKK